MTELKKCPKCGSRHVEQHQFIDSDNYWYLCRECGYVTPINPPREEET